ncbi:MAG: hypothetical protein WED00_05180 [Aquisalimonadaceae bacterium]
MTANIYPGNANTLLYALGSLFFTVLIGVGGPYLLSLELRSYTILLNTLPPFFIRSTGAGAMYATPLVGLIFLIMGCAYTYRLILGKDLPTELLGKLIKIIAVLAVAGLIGLVLGRFVANSYWDSVFRQAGYSRCYNSFFLTSKWFTDAWAQDPAFCRDQEVQRMMTSTKYKIDNVNSYLLQRE